MKNTNLRVYAFFVLLSEAVGVVSGLISASGMAAYETAAKSALTPPAILFPIVWTILYALMGVGAARVWLSPASQERTRGIAVFFVQLAVNFFWSIIFFNLQAYGFAFVWILLLWVLIIAMILLFRKSDHLAAWLQIPYLIWVTFAAYLTYAAWTLN